MNTPLNPLDVDCPACFAPAGKPCTAPTDTDTSRRPVRWTHFSRDDRARYPSPDPEPDADVTLRHPAPVTLREGRR